MEGKEVVEDGFVHDHYDIPALSALGIDVAHLLVPRHPARPAIVKEIAEACQQYGFFQVNFLQSYDIIMIKL